MQLTPLIRLHDGRSVASIAPILILSADERVLSQSYSPKLGHFSVSVQEPFLAFWCQMRTRPSTHTVRFEHRRSRRLTLLGLVSPVSPRLSLSLVVLEDRPHLRIELSRDHNSFLTLNAGIVGHPISELAVPSLSFDPYHPEFVILWYTRGSDQRRVSTQGVSPPGHVYTHYAFGSAMAILITDCSPKMHCR